MLSNVPANAKEMIENDDARITRDGSKQGKVKESAQQRDKGLSNGSSLEMVPVGGGLWTVSHCDTARHRAGSMTPLTRREPIAKLWVLADDDWC